MGINYCHCFFGDVILIKTSLNDGRHNQQLSTREGSMLIKKPDTFKQLTESCLPNADTLDMQQLSGDQRRAAAAAFFSGRSRVIANNWNKNYIQLGIKYSRGVQCRQGILNQENREIQVKKSW